ncbi:hypothetical protein PESP_a2982 [Pseudoalteromonas espejiana DSM 9414]|uniref:Uncharacterized protein n=1 Tax=Pseudoalteromonas espejiana TaxID=28107 RepID=A0A510XZQ6_9GAMM|nr:hypothetical protein [Pseudoalteromonas espejiana]ASM50865.1 hypothetical protein PESP_a2982 [Pseudoalteromonas espejiana DSM 9414]GEK56555.1 hypothetical protein PES01_34000 [Pseudoalteromonas espejiana]
MEDIIEINYLNYSLQELREAWITVDDYTYPERAIEVYKLLKKSEIKASEENHCDTSSTWVLSMLRNFNKPKKLDPTFSDVLLEESSATMKEQRVIKLIAERENIDHM